MNLDFDVIIIGAGAAGLMCAIEASKRKRRVLVLDHANKAGKKILMSGGGRCNFTNYYIDPKCYRSHNPHFFKSALSRYTQWDFISLVEKHQIRYYEKTKGQLFCVNKSHEIVDMLLTECDDNGAVVQLKTAIQDIQKYEDYFSVETSSGKRSASSLVIATGGLSIPTLGASPFAYRLAEQFGLQVWPTRAGLVPFTLSPNDKAKLSPLPGVSLESHIHAQDTSFQDALLFTHRGLSGPAILQISSYWTPGDKVSINLLPQEEELNKLLQTARQNTPRKQLGSTLITYLPKRVVDAFISEKMLSKKLADLSNHEIETLSELIHDWQVLPDGTEGYRTAEVTLGGIDCNAISSKTMQVNHIPGLFFIGEALDVTGWLGGYNFQWAWSSGFAAGQVV